MKVFLRRAGLVLMAVASLSLGACAHQSRSRDAASYGGYPAYPAQTLQVQYGHVRSIEQLAEPRREGSGGGAVVGAVVGGVIGNQVGKGDGRTAATVLGAVGGALLGNEIEKQGRGRAAYRVTVRLERHGGELQFELERLEGLNIGDRVRIDNGRLQRY